MGLPAPSGNGRGQEMRWRHCLRGVRMRAAERDGKVPL